MFHVTPETRAELEALRKTATETDQAIEVAIRKARAEGGSLREIAEIIGLSHTEVRRILHEKGATS